MHDRRARDQLARAALGWPATDASGDRLKIIISAVDGRIVDARARDDSETPSSYQSSVQPTTRQQAIFAGWNDAAWGRERRSVSEALTRWYEIGYDAGLAFKSRRPSEIQ